eukprot:7630953-Pyramimonas_sp.AAC.1
MQWSAPVDDNPLRPPPLVPAGPGTVLHQTLVSTVLRQMFASVVFHPMFASTVLYPIIAPTVAHCPR